MPSKRESEIARKKRAVIGWREWIALPDLGVGEIKAKVDTGARSSALHVFELTILEHDGLAIAKFKIHPTQRNNRNEIDAEAQILEFRSVKSSDGKCTTRPVILTTIELLGQSWLAEVTLANRDQMGFRMLLGREAFRNRFLVDAGKSFFGGRPQRKKRPRSGAPKEPSA